MDQPKEDAAVAGIGSEISPPSAKKVKRCIQSKLSWHKPRVVEVEEEKEKCEEVEGEGKKNGKSRAKTPKKDSKSPQSKLPWYNPQVEETKAVVIEEEKEESRKNEDEGEKKGRKRKSQPRTPQKSPAKSKEARRSSGRNKNNMNCQQLKDNQTGDDTPTTSPTSRGPDHGGSSSKKRSNNRRSDGNKDVDGQNTNICHPLTDLWLEAKKAAEENLRLSAGKQTHPFFTSRKTAKRLPETQEIKKMEARCWPGLDGDYMVSCPPVHVFDTQEDDITSFDWKNWVLTETALSDSSGCHVIEKNSSVFDGSVKPLILGNLHQEGMHLNQLSESVEGQPLPTASVKFASVDGGQLDMVRLRSNISLSPCHARCVDNLENKQQDRLLTERLMSYYQRISCWPECSLWANKYQPENTLEVCGNSESVRFLSEWLKSWNERVAQNGTNKITLEHCVAEESEDSAYGIESDMDDDEATLKNVLLITGPVGSGKSAAIYACAKEHGFEVIEVNTSDVRNGAHMKQEFGQAVDSHSLNKWSIEDPNGHRRKHDFDLLSSPADIGEDNELGSSVEMASRSCKQDVTQAKNSCNTSEEFTISQTANKTLILFEDVDTVFDEDRGFIASILQLAETAKRPIILTSNYRKPVLPQLLDHLVLDFTLPSSEELLSHVHMICVSEKAHGSSDMLERLVSSCLGDIRKALMLLQFWCQGKELQTDRNIQCSYSPLPFDIDAAYLAVPRLIPWELPCKLSEKVGEEVDKTIVMVEENVRRMEAMPLVLSPMEMINLPKQSNVATPAKPRKRALFKSNPSFLDCTEFLDTANGLEDLSDGSGCPGTNARRTIKSRPGIVLSSQSDDGSADERPCTSTFNAYLPDMSSTPILQTAELLNLLELPIDPTCGYERQDIAQQPLGNFETTSVSHICDTFTFQDVSCVPESYFISGTESNREDNFFVLSSHNTSFNLGDSIGPINVPPGDTNNTDKTITEQSKCLEDRNICDEDGESVDGNEEHGDSKIIDESQSCRYQLMDECSRADFSMRLSGKTSECSLEVDLVQETWRKLRHDCDDLKSYLSANRKDASLIVNRVSGLADLISEADILLKSCYPLINDTLEPSMVPCVEPDICSCYEEQMEMGSTYAQHGLCFYTNKLAEVGSSMGHAGTLDLAQEMLASSMSTMALGKLISKGKAISQNSQLEGSMHKEKPRCGIPTGREMEPELYDAILSIVPTRLSMVLRDFAFHEYVSFLSKLSRLECSRLSESTERKRRYRVSRHYLSSGVHSLSDERVQLLAQSGCFKSKH